MLSYNFVTDMREGNGIIMGFMGKNKLTMGILWGLWDCVKLMECFKGILGIHRGYSGMVRKRAKVEEREGSNSDTYKHGKMERRKK